MTFSLHLCSLSAVVLIVFVAMLFSPVYSAESENYRIDTDVLSGGGGECSSAGYYLWHTTGQPSAIGESTSTNYRNYGGFWYTLVPPVETTKAGDCNGDGSVTIDEVQKAINHYLGIPGTYCSDFDGNGICSIDEVQKVINCYLELPSCAG